MNNRSRWFLAFVGGLGIFVLAWVMHDNHQMELSLLRYETAERDRQYEHENEALEKELKELLVLNQSLKLEMEKPSNISEEVMVKKVMPEKKNDLLEVKLKKETKSGVNLIELNKQLTHMKNELESELKITEGEVEQLEEKQRKLLDGMRVLERNKVTESKSPFENILPTRSPLQDLVSQGLVDWVDLGIYMKLPTRSKDEKGRGVVHLAAAKGQTDLLNIFDKLSLDLNEEDLTGKTPLHLAVENKSDALDWLLTKNVKLDVADKKGWKPIHYAAKVGHVDALDQLLKLTHVVDVVDPQGRTPLMIAIAYKQTKAQRYLLKKGAKINARDFLGQLPIHYAVRFSEPKELVHLIKLSPGLEMPDHHGRTPLHYAAVLGRLDMVKTLLFYGAIAVAKDNSSSSPIHLATLGGHMKVVECLLEHGVHVDDLDVNGRTPLHLTVALGHGDMLELLLRWGASVEMQDGLGRSSLDWAKKLKRPIILSRLESL